MQTDETIGLFKKYVIANYTRTPVVFVRGEGSRLWDADGKRYLDLFPGWGVSILGHCHPAVADAVAAQARILMHMPNNFYSEPQGLLARHISEKSFGGQCFFCNSGAEAIEGAVKLARLATEERRYKIVTMANSFHGRTLSAVAATGQPKYHKGLAPLPAGFVHVPFADAGAVADAADDETCAVLVEPAQGEGGVNLPTPGYLDDLRRICDERGVLLIFDEVQTGVGRTGDWFAGNRYGVTPDIMTLAKGLGSGFPIGALVAKAEVAKHLVPGTHASTFGGNPLAMAAGCAVFDVIEKGDLLENVKAQGAYILERFCALRERFKTIRDVRGVGLMIGMELDRPAGPVVANMLENGVVANATHDTVVRLLPAYNITREEIDEGIEVLEKALEETA